jgi:adenylate cyclase
LHRQPAGRECCCSVTGSSIATAAACVWPFRQYLAPDLVAELAAHPERLWLGGEMRPMTILFCDIRRFTTVAEGMDFRMLTSFLNSFLSPMTEIILAHKGTIDRIWSK